MPDIIKEVLKLIPHGKITDACFEGANIVLYTKDKEFFMDNGGVIKKAVEEIKKRIELRPDPEITIEQEKAEAYINKIIPKEAEIDKIIFDAQRSRVIIEAEKPGMAIGKEGAFLRDIRGETMWVPLVRRKPAIRSKLIEDVRAVLYQESDYRRKFLDKTGHRIYDGWRREKRTEWVRLTYLGGGRQVGRSCLFVQTPESRVLMDCGVNVASTDEPYPMLEAPEFNIQDLDAVILSHAHLDHCGFIPYLYKYGYRGPVYCTAPSRDIMALLLLDYVKIMHSEGKEPIFTTDDVKEVVKHTICIGWEEVTDITPDIRITLYNAGHIIGSSQAHLNIGNGAHNIVYTGDMKFGKTMLLEPANTHFPRMETLCIESTYGGKENTVQDRRDTDEELKVIIENTVKRGGKILMPTLGVGRAQEILVLIEHMVKTGMIQPVPVYIDGMVWDITAIHTAYPEFFNAAIRKRIFHKDENPFLSPIFKRVGSHKERMQVIEEEGTCVVLATSGMLVGGPSVEYLKHFGDNPKNALVFTCYQGEGSLGRRIQSGDREIVFPGTNNGETLNIQMEVFSLQFTGHSGRNELMNYVSRCNPKPRKILVNHGESSRCLDLASGLHKMFHIETLCPKNLESVRLR